MTVRRPSISVPLAVVLLLTVVLATVAGPAVTAAATTAAALCATVACLVQARRRRGRIRLTWVALGLGTLCCALSQASPADGSAGPGYFGMIAFTAAGLVAVPAPPRSLVSRGRSAVDALLIAVSLLILSWNVVMDPLAAAGAPVPIAYPVADIVLGTIALCALAGWHRGFPAARSLLLVTAALLVLPVANSAAIRLSVAGAEHWRAVPAAAWFAGFALILLGALDAVRQPVSAVIPADRGRDETRMPIAIILPYAAVLVTLIIGIIEITTGGHGGPVGTWSRFASILLVVLRQGFIMLENRSLARRLESRVAERAAELQGRENRFRALIEQSSESLAIFEADSTVRYQSESIQRIFGFPASALVGHKFTDLVHPRVAARVEAGIAEVLGQPGATTVFEIKLLHGDRQYRTGEMTITNLMEDPYVQGLVFNTRDISEARDLQEQLRFEAYHDSLTGLVNRSLFRDRLAAAVADRACGEEVAILFLDLDGFKEINDSLGHAAGDQLLVQVAARLRRSVAEQHTVARLGGDEFAVIIEAENARDEAEAIAAHILADLDEPFPVGGRDLQVGAGIGIASAGDAGDIEQLQRNADLAMYKAKDAGGGVYSAYHPGMHDALVRRLEFADDLRLALERDEFVLHYQPTVELATGEIVGFEALVRWQHPTRGMVPPLDFIGVAESTGLIVPLGRWVLAEACRQAVAWGAGRDRQLKMAVNMSVRQLDAGDVAAMVAEVLAETGLPADQLCLEMTESVLLTDTDENLARLLRLKALGVMLAMDDFGTGYSSLAYLRRFPMDVLKVDRSFVDRLGGESEDEALVRTIVRLGQRFGMVTVAEGIEDTMQLAALREMGCDYAQGYFFSRPVPAGEAGRLLASGLPMTAGYLAS